MSEDPEICEISDDEQRPATKGDLDKLAQAAGNAFGRVELEVATLKGTLQHEVGTLRSEMDRVVASQDAILQVVQSIDERLKQWHDIPERVEQLERAVFHP